MASILRTGKFVRYFAGFTRNIVFNSIRETENNLIQNTQCICGNFTSNYSISTSSKADQTLERSLKRLDNDVRRIGRISRRDIEEVLEEIRSQKSATSSQSLLIIRCCGNLVPEELPEVRTSLVQEIWKTLNMLKVPMDISHYNALLRVYLENEHQFSPTDFLADLESKGIEPNRVTYQRLISRFCQQGDIEGATRILEYMREKNLPVNENVFNALILGHSQANDMESASGILTVMKQAGLEPSADTYTILLCCYAKRGDIDTILKIMDDCDAKEMYLLDKDYLDVIYALSVNGFASKVDPVLEKIRKSAGYNQDAISVILRLVNKGIEDVAFKILKTMPRGTKSNGELNDTGNFFVRQLVKAERPIENIIKICKEMTDANLNSKALLIAAEASLECEKTALPLLKEMKSKGFPIRQHYFWPLICSSEPNAISKVLKDMQNDFEIVPNAETIREYVIPNLKENNYESIVAILRNAGVSPATAASSAAFNALQKNNMKDTVTIMQNSKAFYSPALFRKPLISALGRTQDFDSYVKIVREIYDSIQRLENLNAASQYDEVTEGEVVNDSEEKPDAAKTLLSKQINTLGNIVMDAVVYFKTNRVEPVTKILEGLVEQGLSISNQYAEKIQERLGEQMTAEISDLLGKLSSGDLEPIEVIKQNRKGSKLENMPLDQLERFIENVEAKGENANNLKRALLLNSIKTKDLLKIEKIVTKLENEKYPIGNGIYAMIIDLNCQNGNLSAALELYEKLRSKEPDFTLDNIKVIKIAELMVKENKFEEAVEFVKKNKKDNLPEEPSFNYTTTCWRLLNHLAEQGEVEKLQKFFETLVESNYIVPNNVLLGPLIKVHLVKNDVKKAIEVFEIVCTKYKTTPWKNELACRLIQVEDAQNLQRLTDLSTSIHGEVNSLYDLVFSFVECGRIRQARKILETPGLRNRPQRINSACERYHQEGMVQPLEGLVEATKDLNHIDRNNIFYNLLLSYCKEDQPEKALGLWTKMQEEDITPSDQFLLKLADFLKSKNVEIPFVVPSTKAKTNTSTSQATSATKTQEQKNEITSTHQKMRQALKSKNIDEALKFSKEVSNDKLTIADKSYLIELLCQSDRLNEANKCVEEMLESKQYPLVRIFKFYLNKLANSGDIVMMDKISQYLDNEAKKMVSFDNRYCHANIKSGKTEQYLNKLKQDLESAQNDQEIAKVAEKFPRGGASGILESHPELIEKFKEVAAAYANKNILGPMNVLWVHYFANDNETKAQEIWDKYLKSSPRLMFQRILQIAREKQDESVIDKLVLKLKESKVSEGALGNAYSCYLDILSTKEKYDEALEVLKTKILADVCLENINKTALNRLKTGIEASGKKFPYDIPKRSPHNDDTSSSSSSSSSSSDEEADKSKKSTKLG
ncbi:leucine-rich PPR motif-containing protein, mitochondrial [Condylostylus longicornis]|uniref:leucine-rich PPR motif-containing protein, mitochondrial n=1 Tax=Condylostylus longicornis TaxID=2530218 RepID=UPI00244E2B2F|nr:leucine-rich PPR motif-containing protein, mitochondrial [Condylostylus longicornis]